MATLDLFAAVIVFLFDSFNFERDGFAKACFSTSDVLWPES